MTGKYQEKAEQIDMYLKYYQVFSEDEEDKQEYTDEEETQEDTDEVGKKDKIPSEEIEDKPKDEGEQPEVSDGMSLVAKALKQEGIDPEAVDPAIIDAMKNLASQAGTGGEGDGTLDPESAQDIFARFIDVVGGDVELAAELMNQYLTEYGEPAVAAAADAPSGEGPPVEGEDRGGSAEPVGEGNLPPKPSSPSSEESSGGESSGGSDPADTKQQTDGSDKSGFPSDKSDSQSDKPVPQEGPEDGEGNADEERQKVKKDDE